MNRPLATIFPPWNISTSETATCVPRLTRAERRISAEAFEPVPGRFFGDYNGISAYGGRVACLWTHPTPEANVLRAAVLDFGNL